MCLAIPGRVVETTGETPLEKKGRVAFGGVTKQVSLAYVPDAEPGDYVLVHVGFALQKIDEREAEEIFGYLRDMDQLDELDPIPAARDQAPAAREATAD